MCQHLHIKLFNRILSFHRNRMPLKLFHLGDVSFCLQIKIEYKIRNKKRLDVKTKNQMSSSRELQNANENVEEKAEID